MDARETIERRRLSFGVAAELYDSVRPGYPREAAIWMLGTARARVADIGAGTGIFSRVLHELGHEVVAIEPDAGMRRWLIQQTSGVDVLEGSAESLPLASSSFDAVTAAQAHHWFDTPVAHTEIARVLRPGGRFAPVWNVRDESMDWVAELSAIVGEDGSGATGRRDENIDFGPDFGAIEEAVFRHSVMHTAESLLALIQSRSHYLVADDNQRRALTQAVEGVTRRLPQQFELPYLTRAWRAFKIELSAT